MAKMIRVALHSPCTWLGVVWQKDIVLASVIGCARYDLREPSGVNMPC
jgi:hypothetical protein